LSGVPNPSTVIDVGALQNPLPFFKQTGAVLPLMITVQAPHCPSIARLFGSGQAKVTAEQIDEDLFLINNELVRKRNSI